MERMIDPARLLHLHLASQNGLGKVDRDGGFHVFSLETEGWGVLDLDPEAEGPL